jgi:O-methyltransferase
MGQATYKDLLKEVADVAEIAPAHSVALVGVAEVCRRLSADLTRQHLHDAVAIVLELDATRGSCDLTALRNPSIETVVVAADAQKDQILRRLQTVLAAPPLAPRVVVAGYEHLEFRDPTYEAVLRELDEPSLANGYTNCRVHLFECLKNAARRGLNGAVVEFGMFRGGTTMFLYETTRRLNAHWKIIAFDSFAGFPERRDVLDLYDHPDLAMVSLEEVRTRFAATDIQIIEGDMRDTAAPTLGDTPVVLAFVDTDNYSSGKAAIEAVRDRVVVGGAIVLDHFTGSDRFVRTIGERIAATELLVADARYFNLHGTGVFLRQA